MSKGGRRVRIFSALEVANICGVVNQTAINWIRNGHLKAFTTPGGQYRIYAKDLAAFLDKRGMGASGEVLSVMMENANWSNILITARPEVNDSLKASMGELLPEHAISQAYDLFEAGRKSIEEKPGFLLLDTDIPGLNVSKFIVTLKSDPVFGRPCIMLLAGDNYYESDSGEQSRPDFIFSRPFNPSKIAETVKSVEKQIEAAAVTA